MLFDARLKPWLIEVNVACSLASSSPLDRRVKHFMITDLLHMVGIAPYDRRKSITADDERRKRRESTRGAPHKKWNIFELRSTALSQLCAEDLELICVAEDEHSRSGHWQRIFPCEGMERYLEYFEFPRYRNTVLAKWMARPDWALLNPLLSPELGARHPLRLVCGGGGSTLGVSLRARAH